MPAMINSKRPTSSTTEKKDESKMNDISHIRNHIFYQLLLYNILHVQSIWDFISQTNNSCFRFFQAAQLQVPGY